MSKFQNNLIFGITVITDVSYGVANNDTADASFLTQAKDAWINFGASTVNYFKSYQFKELVFTLKTISFIVSLVLLGGIIYVFIKSLALGKVPKTTQKIEKSKKKKSKLWIKIEKRFNSGLEVNYKLAVLEADRFYDESLKNIGYDKENAISNLQEIKKIKKIKNHIIDDSGFKLGKEEAAEALIAYKRGLKELGVL